MLHHQNTTLHIHHLEFKISFAGNILTFSFSLMHTACRTFTSMDSYELKRDVEIISEGLSAVVAPNWKY